MGLVLLPNHRCCRRYSGSSAPIRSGKAIEHAASSVAAALNCGVLDAILCSGILRVGQTKPVVPIGTKAELVRVVANLRKAGEPKLFNRNSATKPPEVQLNRLGRARKIVHQQHRLSLEFAKMDQHLFVSWPQEVDGASPQERGLFTNCD